VAYLLPLAALVLSVRLSGTGLEQLAEGVVRWIAGLGPFPGVRFGHVEALANIAVFVPLGFLLSGLLARRAGAGPSRRPVGGLPHAAVWLLATALSAGIEATQLFLLTERSATLRDLACNSAGAAAGVAIHRIIQATRTRSRTRRTP